MIDRSLAHYQITSQLGVGGMGEVYRAADQRLGREVALKILPAEFTSSAERLARFRREARTLAGLNHPNIITVHSIEEEDGVHFLTMELVEGRTLDRVVPERGLDIDRFLELAIALVDAVAAAHAGGVVHRDLKPANVMLGKDDRLKVLDFGLAKGGSSLGDAGSKASTAFQTKEGRILGTVAYMSPEQLHGLPADARSDIFALGILLFYMATGRAPFSGSSSADLMSSILREAPASATQVRERLPPRLARIVARCLEKDPEARFQSARDLCFALEELGLELAAGEVATSSRELARPLRPRWSPRLVALMAVAGVAALAAAVWLAAGRSVGVPETLQLEAQVAVPVVTWPSEEGESRLSPDGEWLSFVSDRDGPERLWIQRVGGGAARALTTGSRAFRSHAWSPDGDEIAALTGPGSSPRLEVLPAPLGGPARLSLDVPAGTELVDWLASGLFLQRRGGLLRFDLETASATEIAMTPIEGLENRRQFDVSADGRIAVFSALLDGRENLWSLDLASGVVTPVTDDDAKETFPHCLGEDCSQIVYLSNRTGQSDIWIAARGGGAGRQLKVPVLVNHIQDATTDGSLLSLHVVSERANLWSHQPATGRDQLLTADSLPDYRPSAAWDGLQLAFQRALPATEIYSRFLDARILVASRQPDGLSDPLPLGDTGYAPLISPDGRWVAYLKTSNRGLAPYFTELWIGDTQSGQSRRLSERFQMTGYYVLVSELAAVTRLWRGPSELLWVEADERLAPTLRRTNLAAGLDATDSMVTLEPMQQIQDLRLSASGELAFSTFSFEDQIWRLNLLAPGGQPREAYSRPMEGGDLRLAGGGADGRSWIVLRTEASPEFPGPVEVLSIDSGGRARQLGTLAGAVGATAVLAPDRVTIFLTRVEQGASTLIAFGLADGEIETVAPNDLPGVTFCGIEPLPDGALIYSKQERNADLWLLRRKAVAPNPNP